MERSFNSHISFQQLYGRADSRISPELFAEVRSLVITHFGIRRVHAITWQLCRYRVNGTRESLVFGLQHEGVDNLKIIEILNNLYLFPPKIKMLRMSINNV